MDEQGKKKFSLGDIIRKINENNADAEAGGRGNTGRSSDGAVQPGVDQELKPRHDSLPAQPRFGPPSTPARETETTAGQTDSPGDKVTPAGHRQTKSAPPPSDPGHYSLSETEPDAEEEFDVFRYVNVIIRRKTPIIVITVCAALYSLFSYVRSEKYYTARARLLFSPSDHELLGTNQRTWRYWVDREKIFNTHLELLKSHTVLNRVAETVGNAVTSGNLKANISIRQGESEGQKNDIIELSYNNSDAELARDALNSLCNAYIDYRRDVNAQEFTRLIFKLEVQIDKLQEDLNEKENALRQFKEKNRMVQLADETNLVVSKLSTMELALQQTQLDLLEAKERLLSLNNQIGQQEINIVQSMSYDNAFQNRLGDLELQLSTLSAEYSAEHYRVKTVKQQIDTLKKAMESDLHNRTARQTTFIKNPIRQSLLQELIQLTIERAALETKRTAQEQIIEKLNGELLHLPSLEQQFAFLQRETESLVQTLRLLKSRYEEAKIQRESQESDLKILELAQTPATAISRVKFKNILVGIFIGLLLGIALAFLLEYLDQTVKDPTEAEKLLEMPLLGYVPLIHSEKGLVDGSNQPSKSSIEPFRAVRANLKHLITQQNLKTIIVCSAVKGEGKTTLAANLAITFALDGKKVVLVDCDLRRPQIHKIFDINKENGATDYLQNTFQIDDILKKTPHANLHVITSGEQPHNPAELIGTHRFDQLIADLRGRADIVFFDSPAFLPVSDVITMAPKMDGVILVVRTLWTPAKAAKQATVQLRRIGCTMCGCIINAVSQPRGYYPYYYGYYGYYSYKYSYDYQQEPKKNFSMRRLGISMESRFKEFIRMQRYRIPHYLAVGNELFRHIIRRRLFWFLTVILAALVFVEVKVRPPETGRASDPIQYMTRTESETSSPIEISPSADEQTPAADSGLTANGKITASYPSVNDSLTLWIKAYNEGNVARYLSFYDSTDFLSPGKRFDEWAGQTRQKLLSARTENAILYVESFTADTLENEHVRISAVSTRAAGTDTVRFVSVTTWKRNAGNKWRIIREIDRKNKPL